MDLYAPLQPGLVKAQKKERRMEMGYKKISHKSKEEGKIKRCVECLKRYNPEPEDDGDTCPRCAKNIVVQMLEEDADRAKEGPREIRMEVG